MSHPLTTAARESVVADVLTTAKTGDGWDVNTLAAAVVAKLDSFDKTLTDPPGKPHIVPAYGDAKSQKVIEALLAKPEVLYGVLGILHNIDVAGPWEHKIDKNDDESWSWFRRDARRGGQVARITPLDKKRGNTQCKWEIQNRDLSGKPSKPSGNAADLAEAMAAVDIYLGVTAGYILVPGFKEA